MPEQPPRALSRNETHDLSMIIKDRTKVLRAHADEQAAACMADFEQKLAAIYSWDQDDIWKDATEESLKVIEECQIKVAKRCEELGIPKTFAPRIEASWSGRGENAVAGRRAELRRVAKSSIEAMTRRPLPRLRSKASTLGRRLSAWGFFRPRPKCSLNRSRLSKTL